MKKLSLLLSIVLCLSLVFTGCQSEPETTAANGNLESASKAGSDEEITITLIAEDFSPSNPDDIEFMEKVYEQSGIKVELVEIASGNYSEKLNLMLATTNDIPDIIWFRDGVDKTYAEQGLLLDMNEFVKNSDAFNGKIPQWNQERLNNYPYVLAVNEINPYVALVREDWMNELGLEIPTTVEEYYEVMKAFATSDLDGNGEMDTFGITDTGNTNRMDCIFNPAFGINSTWMDDGSGNFVYKTVTENEKEKLAFYAKLYEEKILDPEYLTVNWQSMEDRLYAGQVGMVMGRAGIIMDLYTANLTDRGIDTRLIALEPPVGTNGNSGLAPIDVSRESRGFAITKSCENPEKAFELLEFFMSDEGQMLDRLGVEGREYTSGDNGELVKTDKGLTWWSRFFEVPGWESPIPPMSDNAAQALDMTKNFYSEDITYTIPTDMTSKWDEMDSLYKEYASRIIMGDYSIDKFDEFVEKWYAAGGEEITSLANQELKK